MLALHGPMGPFKAVGNNLGRKVLGPFGNIDTAFPCSGGPIQSSRKQSLLGSSVNIDAGYACSGGPIQSCRKHSREESTGPIREHRYRLSMLRWARSKQSETIFIGPLRKHRDWLCMLWRAYSKQSETIPPGLIREHRCWLCMLWWAHSKLSEAFSGENYWAHSGTLIPPFHAPVGPFKAVGKNSYWAPS
jgi:hypothetical protein